MSQAPGMEHKAKGNEYFKGGNYSQAIECYEQALGEVKALSIQTPELSEELLLNNMAISAIKLREYNKAVEWTNQVLQINPSSAKALARNATAQGYLHQWDKATQSYEACFKSSDNLSQVFESLQTFQNYFVDQNRHTPVNHPLWGYDTSTLGPNPMFKLLNVENGKQLYHSDPSVRMIANKSIGCLLGKALADSLGSSGEFRSDTEIKETFGRAGIHNLPMSGQYTDDSEMAIALAASIIAQVPMGISARAVSYQYAKFFYQPPRRGYGPAASNTLTSLYQRQATNYLHSGRETYPDGSYANGGCMRIAPIGVCFRNAPEHVLEKAVTAAVICTHVHPEAVDGSLCQARVVAHCLKIKALSEFDPRKMLQECIAKAKTWIIKEKISAVLAELDRQNVFHSKLDRSFQTLEQWEQDHAIDMKFLTTVCKPNIYSSFFQIRASEAMACVLYAIAKYYLNPEQCLIKIVNYGGDADTTAAIAGAILGALHGISWIPVRWYNRLENYSYGRDMIINIAIALSKCDFRTNDKIYDLPDNCINWNLAFSE